MVVWNSILLKIIIIPLDVVKQHVRFIFDFFSEQIQVLLRHTYDFFLSKEINKIVLRHNYSDECTVFVGKQCCQNNFYPAKKKIFKVWFQYKIFLYLHRPSKKDRLKNG